MKVSHLSWLENAKKKNWQWEKDSTSTFSHEITLLQVMAEQIILLSQYD